MHFYTYLLVIIFTMCISQSTQRLVRVTPSPVSNSTAPPADAAESCRHVGFNLYKPDCVRKVALCMFDALNEKWMANVIFCPLRVFGKDCCKTKRLPIFEAFELAEEPDMEI